MDEGKFKINLVIVGGGYVGSMAAILASKNPAINVNLIEKDSKLCGLYNKHGRKIIYFLVMAPGLSYSQVLMILMKP